MSKYFFILIISIISFSSCQPITESVTDESVTEVNAYVVGNYGNVSNIKVEFVVANDSDVKEYRIILLRDIAKRYFKSETVNKLSDDQYLKIIPRQSLLKYSIPRLPSGLMPIDRILPREADYVINIAVVRKGNSISISKFSNTFRLKLSLSEFDLLNK